jgi:HD-like signal output (HDOD) protein
VKVLFIDENSTAAQVTRSFVQDHHLNFAAHFATADDVEAALSSFRFDLSVFAFTHESSSIVEKARIIAHDHPAIARLVMSDVKEAARLVPAHLYLPGRVQPDVMRRALLATMRWSDRLGMARLADIVLGADRLPAIPDLYLALRKEMQSADPSMERVGKIIRSDPAISVKVLTLVNSSLYGLRAEVSDVGQAVALLGMNTVSSLALAAGVFEEARSLDQRYMKAMWAESQLVAWMAKAIVKESGLGRSDEETASLAGLLHDIGDVIFLKNWPREFLQIDPDRRAEEETARFGATHADIGAYLATLWMLPDDVAETISFHHAPSRSKWPSVVSPVTAVHVARAFVDSDGDPSSAPLDLAHIEAIGVEKVERWFDQMNGALARVAAG